MASLRSAVTSYYRHVHDEVERLCQELPTHPSAELIHDLRVQLKRIRFLRKVIKRYATLAAVRPFRVYIQVFDRAGQIRGYQMNQYRVSGQQQAPDAREQKLMHRLCARLPKDLRRMQQAKTEIEREFAVTKFPTSAVFLRQLTNRVKKRITPFLFTHELHRSRKLLKEIAYSAELSPALHKQIQNRYRMPVVAELEDKIGDWHDLALALHTRGLTSHTREKIAAQKKAKLQMVYQLLRSGLTTAGK